MSFLNLENVTKIYPNGTKAVNETSLSISEGELMVFVGPSGCGKSTLLRMIAGLEDITDGEIKLDNRVINKVDPSERDVAMVFQNYALYPHMNVFKNLSYGLKNKGESKKEIEKKVNEVAELLEIKEFLQRKPGQLSGGQRQRVAMGRAIVRNPKAFLFDEPLSNLDAKLRIEMRREIKKLHKNFKTTMVYVTHDQTEAMSLGTKIAIMNNGKIEQFDTPSNIYNKPDTIFVADFVGSPSMNFISGHIKKNNNFFSFLPDNEQENKSIELTNIDAALNNSQKVFFGIRPEHVFLKKEHAVRVTKDHNFIEIEVKPELHEYIGHEQIITFNYCGQEILGKFSSSVNIDIDKKMTLFIDFNSVSIFDKDTRRRI